MWLPFVCYVVLMGPSCKAWRFEGWQGGGLESRAPPCINDSCHCHHPLPPPYYATYLPRPTHPTTPCPLRSPPAPLPLRPQVLAQLNASLFDLNPGMHGHLPTATWRKAVVNLLEMLRILQVGGRGGQREGVEMRGGGVGRGWQRKGWRGCVGPWWE